MNSTTTTTLVTPEKASKPTPTAAGGGSSNDSLSMSALALQRNISTPPPLQESLMRRSSSMTSPPPPPKRLKFDIIPAAELGSFSNIRSRSVSLTEPQETPATAQSVLIDLNSGHSILNNPKSADAPPPRMAASSSSPRSEGGSRSSFSVGSAISSNGPILSLDDTPRNDDSDGDEDAELASYFPRIRLQMRPSRRFAPASVHASSFVPIQDDASEASGGHDSD